MRRQIVTFVLAVIFLTGQSAVMAAESKPADKAAAAKVQATAADVKAAVSKPAVKAKDASSPVKAASADDAKILRKIVEGKITSLTKRSISVEYETTGSESNEMLLPLGSSVTVEGVKAIADFRPGDHVKVGVEQSYKDMPDGEHIILKTEALVIALVERASDAAVKQPVAAQ